MEQLTNCFGVNIDACKSCKRLLPIQQDNIMRMYFIAPPHIHKVIDTVTCDGYINNKMEEAAND